MIRDVNKANQSSEASAMEIMRLNNAMETIYGFYYQQDKNIKESNLAKYEEFLEKRKSLDDDIDVVVEFYSAVCDSLRNLKYSKQDKKLHKERIKKMKDMFEKDDFSFLDPMMMDSDIEEDVKSPSTIIEPVNFKKK